MDKSTYILRFSDKLTHEVKKFLNEPIGKSELNYLITRLCDGYAKEPNYATYNAIMGVLESVKQEYYRRRIVPYEDKMKLERGDVY